MRRKPAGAPRALKTYEKYPELAVEAGKRLAAENALPENREILSLAGQKGGATTKARHYEEYSGWGKRAKGVKKTLTDEQRKALSEKYRAIGKACAGKKRNLSEEQRERMREWGRSLHKFRKRKIDDQREDDAAGAG